MKKIIVLFLLLVSFQLFSDDDEKPKLAVMEFDDLSGKLSKNMLSRATELIRSKFVASNKFIVIAKERQEKAMIKEMKKESYKACNDKNCQIPLGQALSADTILRTTINFFGGTYTITSELIDLEKEATVQGAEAAFNGTEKSLNAALNDIVKQIIVVRTAKEENMPVASSQDKRACEYARNDGNLETWEEYLAAFPNGECSFEAKSKIRKLKKEEENTPKTCVQKYKKEAEQGNAEAQHKLGNCYYNGEETAKDYYEAFKWYKLSAEKGYMYAERSLGYCYEYGEGTAKDYNEAFKWYKNLLIKAMPKLRSMSVCVTNTAKGWQKISTRLSNGTRKRLSRAICSVREISGTVIITVGERHRITTKLSNGTKKLLNKISRELG